jgi:hypothetical protein
MKTPVFWRYGAFPAIVSLILILLLPGAVTAQDRLPILDVQLHALASDQMIWPGVIERAVAVIEEAPFLSQEQKRDIFYNNAARFLRLSEEEIARHHGK